MPSTEMLVPVRRDLQPGSRGCLRLGELGRRPVHLDHLAPCVLGDQLCRDRRQRPSHGT